MAKTLAPRAAAAAPDPLPTPTPAPDPTPTDTTPDPGLVDQLDAVASLDPTDLDALRPKTVAEGLTTQAQSLANQEPAQVDTMGSGDSGLRYYGNALAEQAARADEDAGLSDAEKQYAGTLRMIGELEWAAVNTHGLEGDRELHARAALQLRLEAGVPFDLAIDRFGHERATVPVT